MKEPFYHIISTCILAEKKKLLLLADESTRGLVDDVLCAAREAGKEMEVCYLPPAGKHGEEPPADTAGRMMQADAVLCMTKYSLAHTAARISLTQHGIPFLSMPDYGPDMLANPALMADYAAALHDVECYTRLLTQADTIRVTSGVGTDLMIDVRGRQGNCCPGFTDEGHLLGSPPDIEANISPVEDKTHGVIAVNGSVTDARVGLLPSPLYLDVVDGAVRGIRSEDKKVEETVKKIFEEVGDPKAYIIGELGIGLNDKASLCGNMLVDEGTGGCIHFGIGSNWTIGGANRVDFHLDFVVRDATVTADGRVIIEEGKLLYGRG